MVGLMSSSVYTSASVADTQRALRHVPSDITVEVEDATGIFGGYATAVDIYSAHPDAQNAVLSVLRAHGIPARSTDDLERESILTQQP